ncbi:MAG TPA: YdeI/OmpD-associated family protein [Candidatus Acidoferrales bacterium]
MLRYVDVPKDLGAALAKEFSRKSSSAQKSRNPNHIPVVATVNGGSTRTTLVPAGGGHFRLQFNATLRQAARADAGQTATVSLKLDLASRDLPIPLEFEAAMQRNRVVRREFNQLPAGLRMQLLRVLNKARSPATLHKRVDRTAEILLARALRKARKKKSPARKLP